MNLRFLKLSHLTFLFPNWKLKWRFLISDLLGGFCTVITAFRTSATHNTYEKNLLNESLDSVSFCLIVSRQLFEATFLLWVGKSCCSLAKWESSGRELKRGEAMQLNSRMPLARTGKKNCATSCTKIYGNNWSRNRMKICILGNEIFVVWSNSWCKNPFQSILSIFF